MLGTFTLALLLRVIFVFQWSGTPYAEAPLLDAKCYDDWAQAIASGEIFRSTAFYQSPLFPYILALIYRVFGHNLLVVGLFNALLGAGTAALLTSLTLTYFGRGAAIVTCLIAAFYRSFIFYTAPVMKEPLGLFLLALFLLLALRALHQNKTRDHFYSGALLGLGALVRSNVLLFMPVFLAFAYFKERRGIVRKSAVFIAGAMLFIAPATLHNYMASRDFVLINYLAGFNLYIGNSPTANGTNAYPPEVSTDPVQEEITTAWIARRETGRDLRPSEISAYWRGLALDFIETHPWKTITLLMTKTLAFWNTSEGFDSYDIPFIEKNFNTLLKGPLIPFWVVSFLAAFGAVAAGRARRYSAFVLVVFALVYMVSVLPFFVTDRYRLPVVLFLLPLAGAALPSLLALVRAKKWPQLIGACALALFFLFLGLRPDPNAVDMTAFNWGTLSAIYADEGRNAEALESLHKGLAIGPELMGFQPIIRGSYVYERLGNHDEAERLLKMAMTYYPQDGHAYYSYGRFKAARGDLQGALASFEKAIELTPVFDLSYYALARIYEQLNKRDQAIKALKRGLVINPHNTRLKKALEEFQKK